MAYNMSDTKAEWQRQEKYCKDGPTVTHIYFTLIKCMERFIHKSQDYRTKTRSDFRKNTG